MDYRKTAQEIYDHVGKKENIISAAHCATRLRLVIADNDKADKEYVENIDGVKGVFFAQGQMQIILGTGVVNKVYDEFIQIAGISESSKDELKKVAASKANPIQRLIKTLGDIFVPIIPAIVASGFLMGIMEALNFMVNNGFLNINTNGSIYVFAQLFSNTAYTFLPILIAYSGAKVFGANPYLGAVIGMIMIHPNLQNAWTVATEGVQATQKVWFGLYSIDMVGYQGHVIPVIIAVWVLAQIEKRLHKVVPAMFDLFVTPLVSVFVTGYLTLSIIGPIFVAVENGLLDGIQWLIALPFGIGSFIMGAFYAPTVVAASMENDLMESIEPFDFKEAVDFQTAYLAGYFADKYDVTASECEERANERIRRSTEAAFRDTVRGYASVVPENTSIRLHNGTTKYALYPVWILQTKWKGDNYIFAMNGQTGKFVGNLPTDKNAFARWFLGTTGVVSVITYIILYLIWAL